MSEMTNEQKLERVIYLIKEFYLSYCDNKDEREEISERDLNGSEVEDCTWKDAEVSIDEKMFKFTQVEQSGGEGQGDTYYVIVGISAEDEEYLLKYEGWYDSWNGTSWDDQSISLVEPVQVQVTQYHNIISK